jgi:hypothetical protein
MDRLSEFTQEAGLVIIDFMIRHGVMTSENESAYLDIVQGLRSDLNGLAGP